MMSFALGALACSSSSSVPETDKRVIVVPSTASSAPPYRGDGSPPTRRYVVRMSDGARDWEVEFPESATGYQLRIPLKSKGMQDGVLAEGQALTEADKELLETLRRRNVGMEREGVYEDGTNAADDPSRNQLGTPAPGAELDGGAAGATGGVDPWAGTEDQPAPTRRSYFLGVENVKKLYRAGRYEMAIVMLKDLDGDYPDDPTILSMMGTLYLKVGQPELARDYWERVLQIDPNERAVIEALRRLNQRAPSAPSAAPTPQPDPPAPELGADEPSSPPSLAPEP